jgi:hypothetical protein
MINESSNDFIFKTESLRCFKRCTLTESTDLNFLPITVSTLLQLKIKMIYINADVMFTFLKV